MEQREKCIITPDDHLSAWVGKQCEIINMTPQLLTQDHDAFQRWFMKLYRMDPRGTLMALRMHANRIPQSHIAWAQRHFRVPIIPH